MFLLTISLGADFLHAIGVGVAVRVHHGQVVEAGVPAVTVLGPCVGETRHFLPIAFSGVLHGGAVQFQCQVVRAAVGQGVIRPVLDDVQRPDLVVVDVEAIFRITAVGDAAVKVLCRGVADHGLGHAVGVLVTTLVVDRHGVKGMAPVVGI